MQVDTVLADLEGVGPEFQAHVDRDAAGRDSITVRVEADDRSVTGELERRLRDRVGLRIGVEVVEPGSLPRSERKTQRVFDHRVL